MYLVIIDTVIITQEWKLIQQPTDPSVKWPKGRHYHSSVLINTTVGPHLLVVGGYYNCKDCWLLCINTGIWKEVSHPQ